jgi:preflagellin peptidase FlaK
MIAVGCLIALYNCFRFGIPFLLGFTLSVFSTFCLTYLFFRLRLFGGADAKCLIALSVLIPVQPDFAFVYSQLLLFPFAITTLLNAAIISLCVPLGLFVYNLLTLSREELKGNLGLAFIGYKSCIEALSDKAAKHTRLVHLYEEAESDLNQVFVFGGVEIDTEVVEELKKYHAQGKIGDKVWVTPELPFILFITAGFFTALLFGNLIFCIMFSILL